MRKWGLYFVINVLDFYYHINTTGLKEFYTQFSVASKISLLTHIQINTVHIDIEFYTKRQQILGGVRILFKNFYGGPEINSYS